jgi:hypothetical protein
MESSVNQLTNARVQFGIALFFALSGLSFASNVAGAVPMLVTYQGRLTGADELPVVEGYYQMRFRIYDAPNGGNTLWDNDYRSVLVVGGIYSYQLGDSTAFGPALFSNANLWLGITVGNDPEILPRTRLTSVPFAERALSSDSAGGVAWGDISGIPSGIADGDDVGIGDITGVSVSGGLTGGGDSGAIVISLPNNAITSDLIQDGAVQTSDLAPEARPAGARISLNSIAKDCSAAPTLLDSFVVNVPAPGYLMVTVNGRYLYNIDATTTSSITNQLTFGLDTAAGLLGANSHDFYHMDPDNASSSNMVWPFTLSLFEAVTGPSKSYFVNARTTVPGANLSLYAGSYALIWYFPAALNVTTVNEPPEPSTLAEPRR